MTSAAHATIAIRKSVVGIRVALRLQQRDDLVIAAARG